MSLSGFDMEMYANAVAYMSRISRLYSTSSQAYIVYRFVEKLFCATTGADDLASQDISFDAKKGDLGFGIKTFVATSGNVIKREKIAEFTKDASNGEFAHLDHEALAHRVAHFRNARVSSDAAEIGITTADNLYHCLVRVPGHAFVHEEPYDLIDIGNISPISMSGAALESFPQKTEGTVYFTDGKNSYQFITAKNTLVKSFDLTSSFVSQTIATPIDDSIWAEVLGSKPLGLPNLTFDANSDVENETITPDEVILPLYSTRSKDLRDVPLKSGINQWNAGGRARTFGEAYIPVPSQVHKVRGNFFPPRDTKFTLNLPNGQKVSAKICQDNSKALMSDPNDELCRWLFSTIDGSWAEAQSRLIESRPYTYDDLLEIGKDSVRVWRDLKTGEYFMRSAPTGSYEKFLEADTPN